ncbi:MAG: hypothetical protein RL885_21205 [Planctomycetota bacterium]
MLSSSTHILMLFATLALAQEPTTRGELAPLLARQHAAAIRYDRSALEHVASEIEQWSQSHPDDVNGHFAAAVANWQLLFELSGLPRIDTELLGRLDRATTHLETAVQIAPDRADAHALLGLCRMFRSFVDSSQHQSLLARADADLERALELSPDDPRVLLLEAFRRAANRQPSEEDVARFEKALRRFGETRGDAPADWWHLSAFVLTIRIQTLKPEPDHQRAEVLVGEVLTLCPELRTAKELLAPMVEGRKQIAGAPSNLAWQTAAIDPEGDATSGVDGKEFSWAYQAEGDWLWLRFTCHEAFDAKSLGVNLIVDGDLDAETGEPWWGGNEVSFDRLVSVWITLGKDQLYRGFVGIGSASSAVSGDPTDLLRGGLGFCLADDGKSILVRVPRATLDDDGRLRVLAAVGTHTGWSDDIPSRGMVDIDLELPQGDGR